MPALQGIVVYEIIDNGKLLNGIYTNNGGYALIKNQRLDVINEIAIWKDVPNENPLTETYELSINNGDVILNGIMEIEARGAVYFLRQSIKNKANILSPTFEGFGFKSGNNHMSFTYWEVTNNFSTI